MIQGFRDKRTEDIFHGISSKRARTLPQDLHPICVRKLDMLNAAKELKDLKVPPGNMLEQLSRDLKGFHSIRINKQWRIVFRWTEAGPDEVEIVDYH